MLKTIIKLPDGTEISSGSNAVNAIQSVTLTECVNSGEDLTIGSTCANAIEVTLITPEGGLNIAAGTRVSVLKQDGDSAPVPVGVFNLEKPTRPTANTMKLIGYDRVAELDRDLTDWLNDLYKKEQWAYTLTEFATMVCAACGLTFKVSDVPNAEFAVPRFTRSAVTGRQLMQWLGEICCRFCRADAKGNIEFAWYTPSGKTIMATGERYYFQNGLSYEDYQTAAIDAVQLRLANSENGALWPDAAVGANSYIITDNAILNARITEDLLPYLQVIQNELSAVKYTPCKVSLPASLDIRAGSTVSIIDKNGVQITAYVMTKTQTGQKDTLECTGNSRRDTPTAVNGQQKSAAAAAQDAFAGMTQRQIFDKLTEGGIQGLFMKDGQVYVNASYLATGVIVSADGTVKIELNNNRVVIDGTRNGYKTQVVLSSSGLQGYGEDANGEMKKSFSLNLGVGNLSTGLWNEAWGAENTGLIIGTAEGELSIGTSTAGTSITGSGVEIFAYDGSGISVYPGGIGLLGKNVYWKDNGDGTYALIGQ